MTFRFKKFSVEEIILLASFFAIGILNKRFIPNGKQEGYVFYLGFLIWAVLFAVLSEHANSRKISRIFFLASIVSLAYVMAFRSQTGTDDWVYKAFFENAGGGFIQHMERDGMEAGFKLLMYVLYYLTNGNYNAAQVIIVMLSFLFWGMGLWTYREYFNMPIAVLFIWTHMYFVIMNHGLLRIYLAATIVFYALHYIEKRQYGRYLFWIFAASLIHMSAWIMLLLLLFSIEREFFIRYWYLFLIVVLVILPVSFLLIARYLAPSLGARYAGYTIIRQLQFSLSAFDTAPVFLVGLYYLPRIDQERKKMYIISLILVALSAVFSLFSSMVDLGRVVYYANAGIIFLMAMICKTKSKTLLDYVVLLTIVLYAFVYVDGTVFLNDYNSSHLFPYESMFR